MILPNGTSIKKMANNHPISGILLTLDIKNVPLTVGIPKSSSKSRSLPPPPEPNQGRKKPITINKAATSNNAFPWKEAGGGCEECEAGTCSWAGFVFELSIMVVLVKGK